MFIQLILNRYRAILDTIRGTEQDVHPVDLTDNNNIPVTYRKSVVMLDSIAQEIGYDTVTSAIAAFYNEFKGKPNLQYGDFEYLCSSIHDRFF